MKSRKRPKIIINLASALKNIGIGFGAQGTGPSNQLLPRDTNHFTLVPASIDDIRRVSERVRFGKIRRRNAADEDSVLLKQRWRGKLPGEVKVQACRLYRSRHFRRERERLEKTNPIENPTNRRD